MKTWKFVKFDIEVIFLGLY